MMEVYHDFQGWNGQSSMVKIHRIFEVVATACCSPLTVPLSQMYNGYSSPLRGKKQQPLGLAASMALLQILGFSVSVFRR